MLGTETTRERKIHPMTMMKRLATLVLALAMLLTLAACGGDNTDENDAQSGGSTLHHERVPSHGGTYLL